VHVKGAIERLMGEMSVGANPHSYDQVQFPKGRGWMHRNRVKSDKGAHCLAPSAHSSVPDPVPGICLAFMA